MSIVGNKLIFDVVNAAKPTRYNVFLELFNHLPVERMAQRLVNRFAAHEIEGFIAELQKELKRANANIPRQ